MDLRPGHCFKCGRAVTAAAREPREHDVWELPAGAVHFHGGTNFGSTVYDAMMDGVMVEVLICDDCLREGRALVRHVRYDPQAAHRHCQACKDCSHVPPLEIRYGLERLYGERRPGPGESEMPQVYIAETQPGNGSD